MKKICVIAGNGLLPSFVIKELNRSKTEHFVIGFDSVRYDFFDPNLVISFRDILNVPNILKKNNADKVVFAGGIKFEGFRKIKLNFRFLFELLVVVFSKKRGDNFLLNSAERVLEKQGIKVVAVNEIVPDILANKTDSVGSFSKYENDIKFGNEILLANSRFDIGQAIVVQNGRVVAIEALEGTQQLIQRSKGLALQSSNSKMVLIKTSKLGQNRKMDLPTIGTQTIADLANSGFAGVAIQNESTIILEKNEVKKLFKEKGIFLAVID